MNRYSTEKEVKEAEVGEVFHVEFPFISGCHWGVQFPKGRTFFKTRQEAEQVAEKVREIQKRKEETDCKIPFESNIFPHCGSEMCFDPAYMEENYPECVSSEHQYPIEVSRILYEIQFRMEVANDYLRDMMVGAIPYNWEGQRKAGDLIIRLQKVQTVVQVAEQLKIRFCYMTKANYDLVMETLSWADKVREKYRNYQKKKEEAGNRFRNKNI